MNTTLKNQIERSFILVLSDFKNENETSKFIKSFLTEKEFENLAKRLSVAYWLSKNRSYENIKTNLNVSSATIAEIQKLLKKEGVKLALKKLDADEWANKWSSRLRELLKNKQIK